MQGIKHSFTFVVEIVQKRLHLGELEGVFPLSGGTFPRGHVYAVIGLRPVDTKEQ